MRKEGGGEEEESRLESKSLVSDWKMLKPQQNKSTGTVEMTTREEEKKNLSDKRREKVSAHTGAEMIMKQLLGSCRDTDHTNYSCSTWHFLLDFSFKVQGNKRHLSTGMKVKRRVFEVRMKTTPYHTIHGRISHHRSLTQQRTVTWIQVMPLKGDFKAQKM